MGDVEKGKEKPVENYVKHRLVLVSHDESTTQANDGKKKSWVHENEHALKKKGVGHGIHERPEDHTANDLSRRPP